MTRFNQVVYQSESQTAIIGAGQIWDNVYEKLAPHGQELLISVPDGIFDTFKEIALDLVENAMHYEVSRGFR